MKCSHVAMVLLVAALGIGANCTPAQRQAWGTAAVDLTTAACVILKGPIGDGTVDTICATEEELAPIVKHLLAMRQAKASKPMLGRPDACDFPVKK